MTGLADMEPSEVKEHFLGFTKPVAPRRLMSSNASTVDLSDVPSRVDWRERGAVTNVRDQRRVRHPVFCTDFLIV